MASSYQNSVARVQRRQEEEEEERVDDRRGRDADEEQDEDDTCVLPVPVVLPVVVPPPVLSSSADEEKEKEENNAASSSSTVGVAPPAACLSSSSSSSSPSRSTGSMTKKNDTSSSSSSSLPSRTPSRPSSTSSSDLLDDVPKDVKDLYDFGKSNNHKWRSLDKGSSSSSSSSSSSNNNNNGNNNVDYVARGDIEGRDVELRTTSDKRKTSPAAHHYHDPLAGRNQQLEMVDSSARRSRLAGASGGQWLAAKIDVSPPPWGTRGSSNKKKVGPAPEGAVGSSATAAAPSPPPRVTGSSSSSSAAGVQQQPPANTTTGVVTYGWAVALLHTDARTLAMSLFDDKGASFLLRGSSTTTRKKMVASSSTSSTTQSGAVVVVSDSSLSPQRRQTTRRVVVDHGQASAHCDSSVATVFDPLILSSEEDGSGMCLAVYKKHREDSRSVVELLCHMRQVEGPDNERVVFFFLPADEEEIDLSAVTALDERRRSLMAHGISTVKGTETGCVVLTPDVILGLTRVSMVVKAQYDVDLKDGVLLKLLSCSFSPIKDAQKTHEKCEEADDLARKYFVHTTMPKVPSPDAAELAKLDEDLAAFDNNTFQRIEGSLLKFPTIHMFSGAGGSSDNKLVWGKGHGEVDECLEDVFAWVWLACSYERMQTHRSRHGDLLRETDASDKSRSQVMSIEQRTAPGFDNRWFETKLTWARRASGELVVSFEPTTQGGATRFTPGAVAGKITGFFLFKQVAPRVTMFTIFQAADLGGLVPKWFAKALIPTALTLILRVQEKFRRTDRIIDKEIRDAIAARIRGAPIAEDTPLNDKGQYDDCSSLKKNFEAKNSRHLVKILLPTSPFVKYSLRPAQQADRNNNQASNKLSGRQLATGKAVAEVDISAEDAIAWIFDYCSRERMRINLEKNKSLPRFVRNDGANSMIAASVKAAGFPFAPREFVGRMSWFKTSPTEIVCCCGDSDEAIDYGSKYTTGRVRASATILWELERVQEGICSLKLYVKYDLCGWIPVSLVNRMVTTPLRVAGDIRAMFQRDEEVDVENRRALINELDIGAGNCTLKESETASVDSVVAEAVPVDVRGLRSHRSRASRCLIRQKPTV